jgi:hypothetical protein
MNCPKCQTLNDKDSLYCKQCGHRLRAARRGFASMDPVKKRAIASKGDVMAHKMGRAHTYTSAEAQAAGRIGGLARGKKK